MCQLGDVVHRCGHAVEKELLGTFLAAMTIWRCDKLFRLWDRQCRKQDWDTVLRKLAAQPNIEKIRKIGVSDIVVVRRISGNNLAYWMSF